MFYVLSHNKFFFEWKLNKSVGHYNSDVMDEWFDSGNSKTQSSEDLKQVTNFFAYKGGKVIKINSLHDIYIFIYVLWDMKKFFFELLC